jgi:hypothetical protein
LLNSQSLINFIELFRFGGRALLVRERILLIRDHRTRIGRINAKREMKSGSKGPNKG